MNNRIEWIDTLKGFILLLVCLGHIHFNSTLIETGLNITTAFRMTTFFFLSGILFSTRKHNTFKSYYQSKKQTLLLPYIRLSILFILIDPRLWNVKFIQYDLQLYESINNSWDYLFLNFSNIFIRGVSSSVTGPLWFVLSLFIVSITFYLTFKVSKGKPFIILLYAILCLSLGWICNIHSIELPFRLATVFTASFFFSFGFLAKKHLNLLTEKKRITIILTIIISFFPYIYFINQNGAISLWCNGLGSDLFNFILSTLTGIFLIINVFILFSKSTNKFILTFKGILKNIARNALIILAVHYWTIRCCNIFLHEWKNTVWFPYLILFIVILMSILAIPLFRNKLYWLIGKKKISIKESLSIK